MMYADFLEVRDLRSLKIKRVFNATVKTMVSVIVRVKTYISRRCMYRLIFVSGTAGSRKRAKGLETSLIVLK